LTSETIHLVKLDQETQTGPAPATKLEIGSQTVRHEFPKINLSPFETYDLHFVRQLVNSLSNDNEVLQQSNQDLKHAFMFLQREHKVLIQKFSA